LNKAKEFVLKRAAMELAGAWAVTDDGVINPYTITISPGVVIPVGSNNNTNPTLSRLDTGGSVELSLFAVETMQAAIKQAFFNDLRDPNAAVRSATEVSLEARDLAKRIGSAYGRLQTEVLDPILKRVMAILVRRGKLDPIVIDGKTVTIKYTSPLARAQDLEDIMNMRQAVEFTMMTAGQDMVQVGFKTDMFAEWATKKLGAPTELLRPQAERDQMMDAAAQAEMAQMAPEGVAQVPPNQQQVM
jgi:hypothetical protein